MEQTFSFDRLPSLDALEAALHSLEPPFAVEVRQGVRHGAGMRFYAYHEFIDCNSVDDLYDFLGCCENGVSPSEPFSMDVEEIRDYCDDHDHPSLSAAERNPSL